MYRLVWKIWGENFWFRFAYSNLFASLPLKTEGGCFRPRLSPATAVVDSALQIQLPCPANPQACPALAQGICHPVVGKTIYCPA